MGDKKAFTLIELLIVIAIIGILSSIIIVSLSGAKGRSLDAKRKSDLHQISLALEQYFAQYGTYQVAGTGYRGVGVGWATYEGYGYPSILRGLVNAGYLPSVILDPSGMTTSNGSSHTGYMVYADANHYTLWANLQDPSAADRDTQNRCFFSAYDNYSSSYSAAARVNYCISN